MRLIFHVNNVFGDSEFFRLLNVALDTYFLEFTVKFQAKCLGRHDKAIHSKNKTIEFGKLLTITTKPIVITFFCM